MKFPDGHLKIFSRCSRKISSPATAVDFQLILLRLTRRGFVETNFHGVIHCFLKLFFTILRHESPTINLAIAFQWLSACRGLRVTWCWLSFAKRIALSQQQLPLAGKTGPFNFYSLIRNQHERKRFFYQWILWNQAARFFNFAIMEMKNYFSSCFLLR